MGLKQLKPSGRKQKNKSLPVLFITAVPGDEIRTVKGLSLGAIDFITKPISKEILSIKVNNLLGLQRYRKEFENEIAERKKAKAAVLEEEHLYRSLIETTNTGYVVIDTRGKVLDANNEYVLLSGHSKLEDILGRSVIEWTAPYEKEKNEQAVIQCSKCGIVRNLEIDYIDKQGKITPIEVNATVVEKYGMSQILTLCRDITKRKKAEEELKESEQKFKGSFKASAIGMALVGLDGKWMKVNKSLCDIVGYSEEELLKKTFQDITHPEDLETDLENVKKLIANEMVYYHLEKRYFHKNGNIVWIMLSVSLVRDSNSKPLYFVSQIEDITERQEVRGKKSSHCLKKKNFCSRKSITVSRIT